MTLLIIAIIFSSILAILFIGVRVKFGGVYGLLTKILASLSFVSFGAIAVVLAVSQYYLASILILLGLIFGLVGDILLDLKVIYFQDEKAYLNFGMLAFGICHILYGVGALLVAMDNTAIVSSVLWAVLVCAVLTPTIILISKAMKINFNEYLIQSIIYTAILTFMSAFTFILSFNNANMWIMCVGEIMFLLSDLVLSIMYFKNQADNKTLCAINHGLYYVAQIFIMTFIFFI